MANFKVNDIPSWVQYVATASQTEFSIPFPFIDNSDLSVWQNGILLTLTTDYTLSGAQTSSGGQLTLNVGASLNDQIVIQDLMAIDRTNIYLPTISALTGSALNNDFNRDVIMIRDTTTTVNYLMLQYEPYANISQDINDTTDRIIPILPPNNCWVKNPGGTAIIAFELPTTVVGVDGVFTATNRITTTNLTPGNNYIQQTDVQLAGDTITAISGNLVLSGTNNVNISPPGQINLNCSYISLYGTQWPTNPGAPFYVPRFKSGSSTQMEFALSPTITGSPVSNSVVVFDGTGGALQASGLSIVGNELSTFSGDLTLGAFSNNMLVTNDPTQALGIATKQYVDNSFAGAITGGASLGGDAIYAGVSGQTMDFKGLVAGTNITLTPSSNTITIAASSSGTITGGTSLGGTYPIYVGTIAPNLEFCGLNAGTNITMTTDGTQITISSTGGGSNFAYDDSLWVAQNNGDDSNSGTSINEPLLLVQTAVTNASTTPTVIYVEDAFTNTETITTLGGGQNLSIIAEGTTFDGVLTRSSADTVYFKVHDTGTGSGINNSGGGSVAIINASVGIIGYQESSTGYITAPIASTIDVNANGTTYLIAQQSGFSVTDATATINAMGCTTAGGSTAGGTTNLNVTNVSSFTQNAGGTANIIARSVGSLSVSNGGALNIVAGSGGVSHDGTVSITGIIGQALYNTTHVYDNLGNTVFQFDQASTPINYLQVTNSSTGQPLSIRATGGDADVTFQLLSSGVGSIELCDSSSNVIIQATPVSSPVNYIQVTNAATSAAPGFGALGSDTDISMTFQTKGAGFFVFFNGSSESMLDINTVASAVNNVNIVNAATGTPPVIAAVGSDTNVDLNLQGQGTGGVTLVGRTDGNAVASGKEGEVIVVTVTSASPVTFASSGTAYDLATYALPAGNWKVEGNVGIFNNPNSITTAAGWVSTSSASIPTDNSLIGGFSNTSPFSSATCTAPYLYINSTGTTNIYLSGFANFSVGPTTSWGNLYMTRVA